MKIRPYLLSDKKAVDKIYKAFWDDNEYPRFGDNPFQCSLVVEDDDGKIILAAGVKTIAEAIAVTDKSRSVRIRHEALLQALGSMILIANESRFMQLHAFVRCDDPEYIKHCQRYGFKLLDAKVLVLDIGEGNGSAETAAASAATSNNGQHERPG